MSVSQGDFPSTRRCGGYSWRRVPEAGQGWGLGHPVGLQDGEEGPFRGELELSWRYPDDGAQAETKPCKARLGPRQVPPTDSWYGLESPVFSHGRARVAPGAVRAERL